jgi:hypothetical protein
MEIKQIIYMKKSWMWLLFGALLAAGSLAMSAQAQSNVVYAVEYNQSTNRFGTIDLLNGNFTRVSSIGTTMINDIAYCPTNGILYGISNTTALVTFNKTNGTITSVATFSVKGIQSLAFRYSDGALFGATHTNLYRINLATGGATNVGNFGSPSNLNSRAQNIRFAQDGNLYVSNTSTNTDLYRINTTNGAATWMGEAVGLPYLMLQNASSNMYGVFINLGTASNGIPQLMTFNLGSFVVGGTNANGSTHQITTTLVGAGTNFPPNFNFSGNVPQAVTNLTVPVSASGPSNQTAVAGGNVVFSTVASGTPPYSYAWLKNGSAISSQTNSSLTLNNVITNDAATYSVIVRGALGTVTNSATLTVNLPVTVTAVPVNQTTVLGGNATFSVTATGTGLSYQWLFNGSVIGISNNLTLTNVTTGQAGVYTVIVNGAAGNPVTNSATLTVNVPVAVTAAPTNQTTVAGGSTTFSVTATGTGLNYQWLFNGSVLGTSSSLTLNNVTASQAGIYTVIVSGAAGNPVTNSATLTVIKAGATITLGSLSQTYTGTPKPATASTTPGGLSVSFTYNGSATVPTSAGSYTVIGTINDANYQGSATNTLVISKASSTISLGSLSQTYDGAAKAATASTTPNGLAVSFTYNGSATVPTSAGSYTVIGTINDANYQGSATNTLVISKASSTISLGDLSQTYDGAATAATASTTPNGLAVSFTYNGAATVPTVAGSYTVIGTINDANYQGSATNTLVISKASSAISLGDLSQTYDGAAKAATASTTPSGLAVTFTYNDSANAPTNAGSYTVIGTINDANYQGSATNALVIDKALAVISLGSPVSFSSLSQTYDGTAKQLTATTTPGGLAVGLTYNGSVTVPINAGSYTVIGTINDANYQGSTTNALVINKALLTVTADNKNKICGQPNPPLTASYNGFVGGESANALSLPAVLNTTAIATSCAGKYPITVGGAAAANYAIQYVDGTLQAYSAPQVSGASVSVNGTQQFVVSFPTIAGQTYQLEYTTDDLIVPKWTPLGTPFAGIDGIIAVTNNIGPTPKCFFRVEVLEVQ